jgi:hypothetical protein
VPVPVVVLPAVVPDEAVEEELPVDADVVVLVAVPAPALAAVVLVAPLEAPEAVLAAAALDVDADDDVEALAALVDPLAVLAPALPAGAVALAVDVDDAAGDSACASAVKRSSRKVPRSFRIVAIEGVASVVPLEVPPLADEEALAPCELEDVDAALEEEVVVVALAAPADVLLVEVLPLPRPAWLSAWKTADRKLPKPFTLPPLPCQLPLPSQPFAPDPCDAPAPLLDALLR